MMWIRSVLVLFTSLALAQETRPPVISPEVQPDRRVTFRLSAPSASKVTVTGEFARGSQDMQKDAAGVWSITVGPLEPEIYHYNFGVDGLRIIDPGNARVKTGSTPSTLASILEVPAPSASFYDGQPVPHGDVRLHWYPSKTTGSLRRLAVYTPPGYDQGASTRYPVLYLLHGANADDMAWTNLGRANLILDNLLAAHKSKPFIVVMPFGYGVPPGETNNTQMFGKDLIDDVIPFIQSRYRAYSDREHRALVGLSMGGGQALTIGLERLDLFSYVGGFSSGLRPADFAQTFANVVKKPDEVNAKLKLLWVGCGREDGAFAASQKFSEFLKANNVKHTFRETSGAHTWMVWRRYLNEVAPQLF